MADYRHAIAKVLKHEGGYVNDPDDTGGETYKGVSRKNWPRWTGWAFVDVAKKQDNFPASLGKISALQDSVMSFYRDNFWNKVGGDQIDDQDIADMLVDAAVNEGIKPAVRRAQKIVGIAQTGDFSEELKTKLNSLV
ncbi:MAG: glycosyl hydrolase 108 family protein [Paludibacter sp.]|nr:glycosyl hydrolase 108 family protein [Paludibacter sp.]